MSPLQRRLTLTSLVALLDASGLVTMLFTLRSVESTVEGQSARGVEHLHAAVGGLISVEYAGIQDFRDLGDSGFLFILDESGEQVITPAGGREVLGPVMPG